MPHSIGAFGSKRNLDVDPEIERAITITEPVFTDRAHRLFFASNTFEVALNVINWNQGVTSDSGADLWGRRTVTYFVYDPRSHLFAPSKFCAFLPVPEVTKSSAASAFSAGLGMSVDYYFSINQNEARFDGSIARRHLLNRLGYQLLEAGALPQVQVQAQFEHWLAAHERHVRVHPRSAHILLPIRF